MKKRLRALHRNERGQVMIFGMLTILFVLVVGGLATDFAHLFVVDDELEKSMDAAALAGAGKLGFNDTVFPDVRAFAQHFAEKNVYRAKGSLGTVTLNPNGNAEWETWDSRPNDPPYGEVVLGVWDPTKPDGVGLDQRFEPSLDGTRVNAVLCRYKARLPTTLFSMWGFRFFNVGASAVAVANPPKTPPPDGCLFPMGVGSCPFNETTSQGCGVPITFISSSNQDGAGCLNPPCSNTAAWVALDGTSNPNPSYLRPLIEAAGDGNCSTTDLETGNAIPTNNGMQQPVFDAVETAFLKQWAQSADEPVSIENASGDTVYEGQGWKVYIPVIETDCPGGAISGDRPIVGWTQFVMTQVLNKGECAVENHWPGNEWDEYCAGAASPSLRAIFGYFSCTIIPVESVPTPVPRSALATKLRLVR